ncbi:MAG: hypothetical protein KDA63_03025 [Planctomycetales bacterium]|nr:hypothetical protein [Planctomycetales bacterium]
MRRVTGIWKLAIAGCLAMTSWSSIIAQDYDGEQFAGEQYAGEDAEIIRERYDNRSVKIERSVTRDADNNYINHGPWKMFNPAGVVIAEGQYEHGQRHGVWTRWHTAADMPAMFKQAPYNAFSAPFVSQATFANGKLEGHWTIFDAKQRRASEFELSDGLRHGMSTWWYPTGEKMMEAFYRDGVIDGEFVEWNPKGEVIRRDNFQEGRKLATKTTYFDETTQRGHSTVRSKTSRKKSEGMYLFAAQAVKTPDDWWEATPANYETVGTDMRHGAWTEWYPTGHEHLTGNFQNDVQVGTFVRWYQNGQMMAEGDFSDGKPHGHWTFWHSNGQKHAEGVFQDGERTGEWCEWDPDGHLAKSHDYSKPHAETAEVQPVTESAGPKF